MKILCDECKKGASDGKINFERSAIHAVCINALNIANHFKKGENDYSELFEWLNKLKGVNDG